MRTARPELRIGLAAAGVVVAFVALCGWLAQVQLAQHEPLAALAGRNGRAQVLRPARRGSLLDIRGNLLATSVPVKTVCADPSMMGTQQVLVARTLAPLLQIKADDLLQRLQPHISKNAHGDAVTNAYSVLKRKVPLDQWLQITQAMSRLSFGLEERKLRSRQRLALQALREKAVFGEDDELRQYPGGTLAAHVLGFVVSEDRGNDQGRLSETHGVSGIELTLDQALCGVYGWRRRGEEVAPRPGLNGVLTLDAGVQNIVETELAAAGARYAPGGMSALVIRPKTGEILALANLPTFDANAPQTNFCNRAISSPTEPGSTFKVVVVSGALDAHKVTLQEEFDCGHGRFVWAGRILHDHASYGQLPVLGIITKSSNIGAAKIGIRLGEESLYRYITNFGFGSLTGIPLPGESRGYLRDVRRWEKLSISRIPMGHEILVTPLQMALAVSAIANRGRLMRPMIVDRLQDESGRILRRFQPELVRQVMSAAAAREMITALKSVVSPEGTAPKAKLEHYTVCGKTGTAEKFVNGTYKSGVYTSSFIGFFPANDPALCISVVFDDLRDADRRSGHYGGEVAGPVFRAIAERVANYLRLPPESESENHPELRPRSPAEPPSELVPGASLAVNRGAAPSLTPR